MAIFQHSDFKLNYELLLHLVAHDTLLIYRSDQQQNWTPFLQYWKGKVDVKKQGRLCTLVLPSNADKNADYDEARESDAVESLLEALGFEETIFMGQTTAGCLALEIVEKNPSRVFKIAVLDPIPSQWEKRSSVAANGGQFRKEALVLQGAFDSEHPRTGAKELAKSLPKAKVLELKDASNEDIFQQLDSFI